MYFATSALCGNHDKSFYFLLWANQALQFLTELIMGAGDQQGYEARNKDLRHENHNLHTYRLRQQRRQTSSNHVD